MMSEEEKKTGSETYHIPKLTEENYRSWAQQLKWILDEKDLLDIVEGKETEPSVGDEEYDTKLATWKRKMKKARSTIGASVTPSVMTYIDGMDDPAKMWAMLAERYNPKSQTTLLQLQHPPHEPSHPPILQLKGHIFKAYNLINIFSNGTI
jgi:hypothetical protein